MTDNGESKEHKIMKTEIVKIMEDCGITTDKEVHLSLDDNREDDMSLDAISKIKCNGKKYMIFFECKSGKNIRNIRNLTRAMENKINEILNNRKINVLKSDNNKIKAIDFKNLDGIKYCIISKNRKSDELKRIVENRGMFLWDSDNLKYYKEVSKVLGKFMEYELYREFKLYFEIKDKHEEDVIKIKQSENVDMYLMGMHPGLLLKIAYVFRRTSKKSLGYQRMIKKYKINKMSNFIKSRKFLLPNSIILTFDENVKKDVKYHVDKKTLEFPIKYCCAWIIDGQHRAFGFLNTTYKNWNQEINDDFKIPVIIFKNLEIGLQHKMFIDINTNQKKIDPTLICELSTIQKNLSNEITWPSLLVMQLTKEMTELKNLVKTSEIDKGTSITLASFVKYALLDSLLGFKKDNIYQGPLFKYAEFDPGKKFDHEKNKSAFKKQIKLLRRFFMAVKNNTEKNEESKDPWSKIKNYSLLKTTGINALLLVLSRILEKDPECKTDLFDYLKPLKKIKFNRERITRFGGGWKGFRNLANEIINELNKKNEMELRTFRSKEK